MLKFSVNTTPTRQTHPSETMLSIEICALLGYYAAYGGNPLPTFRDKLLVPFSRVFGKGLPPYVA